jgi:hypothetical protein
VSGAEGVLLVQIYPKEKSGEFFLTEKFVGRLVAWFKDELMAINLQFVEKSIRPRRSR